MPRFKGPRDKGCRCLRALKQRSDQQTVPTRKATSCGLCEVVRNQKRKGIKKDRTNIFRVCMFSYCPFITNTSVVSGYVGLTSFYESLWPDSVSSHRKTMRGHKESKTSCGLCEAIRNPKRKGIKKRSDQHISCVHVFLLYLYNQYKCGLWLCWFNKPLRESLA